MMMMMMIVVEIIIMWVSVNLQKCQKFSNFNQCSQRFRKNCHVDMDLV